MFHMQLFLCCAAAFLCAVAYSQEKLQESVKVTVFYETLCPYSRDFIKDQVVPGYLQLKDHLNLDLVPFGKANKTRVNDDWEFTCQHGPSECLGNKIQACALNSDSPRESQIEFVGCMMKTTDPASMAKAKICAFAEALSWLPLRKCIQTVQGDDILAQYGDRTKMAAVEYVPHILINDIFDETAEDRIREDFVQTVCSYYQEKPENCNQ